MPHPALSGTPHAARLPRPVTRPDNDLMVDVERERFEAMVGEALDGLPRISAR